MTTPLPHDALMALEHDMQMCPQTAGQSVFAHGASVWRYLGELLAHMRTGVPLGDHWQLPSWVATHAEKLLAALPEADILETYTRYHDCGKPYCRIEATQDVRASFPDHANVSADTWLQLGGARDVADLIRLDMEIHTIKGEQVPAFAALPQAATLLLVGLAEVHSNAALFGGIASQSFKIKLAQLERRGKAACKLMFDVVPA